MGVSSLQVIDSAAKYLFGKGYMSLTKVEERKVDNFFDWAVKQGKIRGKALTLKEGLKEYKQHIVKKKKVVKRRKSVKHVSQRNKNEL